MKPVSPVISGFERHEVLIAKDQRQYLTLPALICEGDDQRVITRWEFGNKEVEIIKNGGSLILEILTFGNPVQPVCLSIMSKQISSEKTHGENQ